MKRMVMIGAMGILLFLGSDISRSQVEGPDGGGGALLQSTGRLTFLRVHEVGTGYGPPADFIDVEVVCQLNSQPTRSLGFQLRDDGNRYARQGMLDLLRDAFNNNWTATIDYDLPPGKNNGVIIRVALSR